MIRVPSLHLGFRRGVRFLSVIKPIKFMRSILTCVAFDVHGLRVKFEFILHLDGVCVNCLFEIMSTGVSLCLLGTFNFAVYVPKDLIQHRFYHARV